MAFRLVESAAYVLFPYFPTEVSDSAARFDNGFASPHDVFRNVGVLWGDSSVGDSSAPSASSSAGEKEGHQQGGSSWDRSSAWWEFWELEDAQERAASDSRLSPKEEDAGDGGTIFDGAYQRTDEAGDDPGDSRGATAEVTGKGHDDAAPLARATTTVPFGPILVGKVGTCLACGCTLVYVLGYLFCRNMEFREKYGRTTTELYFIVLHNSLGCLFAALAWFFLSRRLALMTFCYEIGYQLFDGVALYRRYGKLDPETFLHHTFSPMCILFSTQTTIDMRVLCHLSLCIHISGVCMTVGKIKIRYYRGAQSL